MNSTKRSTFVLIVCLCLNINAEIVQSYGGGKVYVNGREINAGPGQTVVTSGNNGCSIVNDVVYECNGQQRPLSDADRRLLSEHGERVNEYFKQLFPPGFPFVKGPEGLKYPPFPKICRTCNGQGSGSGYQSQLENDQNSP
ncbi:hypothetical protein M3Y94_00085500 [Aphelenchoides besseyi]|nr:hypothetical protein M3Y94_00085500 [Aphelenchoides besseyi]KAI6237739.1 hypothetical protein M3Y95_00296700 [Aphelenchoides besseyi]